MELFLDDRVIIPDDIKNMTPEELDREIERLENEHKLRNTEKQKQTVAL